MTLLQWSDDLDVHVDAMNSEHKELIRLMNDVSDANATGVRASVAGALERLVAYTVKHFENEEAYMASIDFAGLATHKLIHKDLLDRVGRFVSDFHDSGGAQLPKAFFDFLKFWLLSHIQGIDTKYGNN